jgi:endo-1,4-beta-xylanase
MFYKSRVWLLLTLLMLGAGLSAAQAPAVSMRDLSAKNNFYIGAAVYSYHLNDPIHRETLAREFNMLTPENEAKACEVQPGLGRFDFAKLDGLMAFAEANDMVVRGHTLLWHQCVPNWLANAKFSREEAINHMRDHIYTVVGRYKGRIAIWDVVNEAVADDGSGLRDTPWHRLIGDDYIELAFQFAHEADPEARLFYNDYGAEGMNTKSNAIYEMAQDLVARGVPIHGIGLQAHFTVGGFNPNAVAQNMQRIGELGLEVQITELDVRHPGKVNASILNTQALDYRLLLETCMDTEYCTAFVTWGVGDKYTWLRGANLGFFENPDVAPLLFDDDYEPKPAYFAMLAVLADRAGVTLELDEEVAAAPTEAVAAPEIPEPTKSDPAQLAPDSAAGLVYYAAFPVSITLDGETDDWANIPRVTVDNGPMLPNEDTVMTFAAAADADNLYFLAEVQDKTLISGAHNPQGEWYQEDSVELYINATGNLAATVYEPGIVQIGIVAANIGNTDAPLLGGSNSADSQISVKVVETETGYLVEAAVPLVTDVWTIEPEHEGVLGFQTHLNGASDVTARDTKLIWSANDIRDQSWNDPSVFGKLVFWDVNK